MFIENLVVVSLALAVFGAILALIHQMYKNQTDTLMKFLENQRKSHELTQERLMNRAMSRDWQTYVQLQSSQNSNLEMTSDEPYPGMSDAEELIRSGYAPGDTLGLGDTNYEVPKEDAFWGDLADLGLVEE